MKTSTLWTLCVVNACAVVSTSAEKWRFVTKQLAECESSHAHAPPITWSGLRLTFTRHGDVFKVTSVMHVARDTNITAVQTELFKDGVRPFKFLTWRMPNPGLAVASRNQYLEPVFASGDIPRTCNLKKGEYPNSMEFDLHGDMPGSSFRSHYAFRITLFERLSTTVFCIQGRGLFKKDGV